MIVAHRGDSVHAPENTIPSFELAWEKGADAIEGDFQLTRDGHIVCIHDSDTERVSGKDLIVKDSTLEELQELDVGIWKDSCFTGCIIPTLGEVLATVPNEKKIFIEIKCGTEIISPLLKTVQGSRLNRNQLVFISFDQEVIKELKEAFPEYRAFVLGSLKQADNGEVVPSQKAVLEILEELSADGVGLCQQFLTESLVRSIQNSGYEAHVWTVDSVMAAEQFRDWGVKSITTNDPASIISGIRN